MKTASTLVLVALSMNIFAQWSSDPAAPLAICDAPEHQDKVTAISDSSGGHYVFWRDNRSGNYALYGQHIDSAGYNLWTDNGKLLYGPENRNVNQHSETRLANGKILALLGCGSAGGVDTIRALLFDSAGTWIWEESKVVSQPETISWPYHTPFPAPVVSGQSAIIAYRMVVTGGQTKTKIDRIDASGNLLFGINGYDIQTSGFGPLGACSDENNGAIIYWRNSNGAGTHMGAIRVDSSCVSVWPGIVDPVAASSGLGWDYSAIPDGEGGLAIAFVETDGLIKFTRIDAQGDSVFTPSIKTVGNFSSGQDYPRILRHNGFFYVAWEDNRPPASFVDLYLQKLSPDGTALFAGEGIPAITGSTYIPYPGIVPTDSSGVIVAQLNTSPLGFRAQRIRSDGQPAWTEPATFTDNSFAPFYEDFVMLPDPTYGAVAFWANSTHQNIYGARVGFQGNLGPLTQLVSNIETKEYSLFPNPNSGSFTVSFDQNSLSGHRAYEYKIYDLLGRELQAGTLTGENQIMLSDASPGILNFCLIGETDRRCHRVVIQ